MATSNHDVVSHLRVQYTRLVPNRGNWSEETHDLRLAQVMRRTVSQHLQRTFIDDIHRQLMTSSAQAHWSLENGREVFLVAAVDHGARRVVHWTNQHSRKRQGDVVLRIRVLAPLRLLQSTHPLVCQ